MDLEIIVNNLSPLQKNLLAADFEHTKWILYDEMHKTVEKMRGDRGMQYKIIRMLSGITAFSRLTVDSFASMLDMMSDSNMELFEYSIDSRSEPTFIKLHVSDAYFDIFKQMPVIGKFINYISGGKKTFIGKVEKSLKEDYTSDFKINDVSR